MLQKHKNFLSNYHIPCGAEYKGNGSKHFHRDTLNSLPILQLFEGHMKIQLCN